MGKNKPSGYLKKWENVRRDLNIAIQENNGDFPSHKRLSELGYLSLAASICTYHGGYPTVRKRMGYELVRVPNGHYKERSTVEWELKRIIKKLGHFPTSKEIKKNSRGSLVNSIYKHHGGVPEVRERMGYGSDKRPIGYLRDWKNITVELSIIISKLGHFPTHTELGEFNETSLSSAIIKQGGISEVRRKMGYDELRRSPNYWKDWENVEEGLRKAIKKNNGEFPDDGLLRKLGFSGIADAIKRYHGGYPIVRKKMGYDPIIREPNYWLKWENTSKELVEAIERNNGVFPTQRRFVELGCSSLYCSIAKYHGGIAAVRERIGYNEKMRNKLARELEGIVESI
jgi:hypothetical protein